jgi:hypothetical protein
MKEQQTDAIWFDSTELTAINNLIYHNHKRVRSRLQACAKDVTIHHQHWLHTKVYNPKYPCNS